MTELERQDGHFKEFAFWLLALIVALGAGTATNHCLSLVQFLVSITAQSACLAHCVEKWVHLALSYCFDHW